MTMKSLTLLLMVILLTFNYGCETSAKDNNEIPIFTISQDGSFSEEECSLRALNDKVFMIESKYCGHCKATKPDFIASCEEKNIEPVILDISEVNQRMQMESYGISIQFTPTFVIGCDYFIGSRTKSNYLQILDNFNEV